MNYWMPEPIVMKPGMYIVTDLHIALLSNSSFKHTRGNEYATVGCPVLGNVTVTRLENKSGNRRRYFLCDPCHVCIKRYRGNEYRRNNRRIIRKQSQNSLFFLYTPVSDRGTGIYFIVWSECRTCWLPAKPFFSSECYFTTLSVIILYSIEWKASLMNDELRKSYQETAIA
jgi:hypothetical protein